MYTETVPEKVCRQRPRGGSQGKRPATAWPRQTAYHTIVQPTYTRGPRAALALAGSDKGQYENCRVVPGVAHPKDKNKRKKNYANIVGKSRAVCSTRTTSIPDPQALAW